jgi:uncharacterized membrane protein
MSGAHAHLLLNHVPILGTFFGLALLLWGLARRSDEVVRAAWLALVVSALVALPAYVSGEPAEDAVKGRPEVSELLIERHEEAAQKALIAVLALGVTALAALVAARGERPPARVFVAATVLLAVAAGGLLGYAGSLGGQIRHAEIRPGAAAAARHDADESHDDR